MDEAMRLDPIALCTSREEWFELAKGGSGKKFQVADASLVRDRQDC